MTLECAAFFAEIAETCTHRFVVGDALVVVATNNADKLLGHTHLLLLDHIIIPNDAEGDVGRDNRKLVDFVVGEKLVGNLDDTLVSHLLALEVVADGDGGALLFKVKQADDLKELGGWYVVDDCTVLEGSHLEFLSFHDLRL